MMLKQFLGRLPKKPSKATSDLRDASSFSSPMGSRSSDATNDESGNAKDANLAGSHLSLNSSYSNGNISTQLACQSLSYNSDVGNYDPLPTLKDASNSERQSLFLRKLNQCCFVFDFNDTSKHLKEKDVKRQALLEVVEFVSSARGKFTEVMMQEILKAVSANLFRPLATQFHENKALEGNNLEEDEPLMDPAWPHMQYVYELLLRFVASPEMDTKLAKRYIDQSFLLKLLDLFDSEDPREREYLKTILHRIYGKFMVHRPFLRKSMNNIFYRFIFETEKFNGIAELLEVLGSIINGFALPLKEEHKSFLVRVLIPLHKPKCLSMYHQQLSYCITQFVEKDSKLADTVLSGLLKYWPITNSTKEVMFLSELEEVLEATQMPEFQRCMVPLFQQIARSVGSTHFQVAERALYLWNNDHIENLIRQNRKVIMPIIIPSFEKNATSHWNQVVKNLTLNVRRILNDVDPELLKECLIKFQAEEARDQLVKTKQQALWQQLEEIAATKSLSTPSTPMSSK